MFGNSTSRTGIDLGSDRIKLIHGQGSDRLEKITHIGTQPWGRRNGDEKVASAAVALKSLLKRLDLNPGKLGHVAITSNCNNMSVRDVVLPPMSERELQQALPYEARKQLDLESIPNPVLDAQIVESMPSEGPERPSQIRVLMAAVPGDYLDFSLQVTQALGIEPEVVDLEVFAGLNELFAHQPAGVDKHTPIGLLDLAGRSSRLNIASRAGGVMSRVVGAGAPLDDETALIETFTRGLIGQIRDTLTYYRGRYRREVANLFISGGGAYLPGIADVLGASLDKSVTILDPLSGFADQALGFRTWSEEGARFVTACGLCRWWDGGRHV